MIAAVTRLVIAALVLAGCGRDERVAAPVANLATPVAAFPPGWVRIEPSEERVRCANHSRDEWRIAIERGAARISKATTREPDSGPPLPFELPKLQEVRGRRHVLAVDGGFLIGFDAGEWGGSLYWFSRDGGKHAKLGGENVHGLVALGPDTALAIEGLAHLTLSEGAVRWLERKQGSFADAGVTKLPDAPSTHVLAGDVVYVLTTGSLVRVSRDRRATVVQPVSTAGLYPDSMAIDASGTLWVGMRQLVLRLAPDRERFSETWLVREDCRRAELVELDCVCRGG